jgi:hypothetical protein
MVLLAPLAAIATDQTVEVSVLPADTLAVDVESDIGLGAAVPGSMTPENGFQMNIMNTTGGGWFVTVEATDLTSFDRENCDEYGCDRVPTSPLYTIDAGNIYMRGGHDEVFGVSVLIFHEGFLTAAATPALVVEGSAAAYGSFSIENPNPSVQVQIPPAQEIADYWATLTYTIMG